jgi:NADH-quinone oxidoreductase subunit N
MRTSTLVPEVVVVAAALALLLGRRAGAPGLWLRVGAVAAALLALGLELWVGSAVGTLFDGGWQQDRFALFAKAALLVGLVVLAIAVAQSPQADERDAGDAMPLAFLVVFGGMVAASATSLVALWAGLELAALAAVAAAGLGARDTGVRLLLVSAVAGGLVAVGFAIISATAGSAGLAPLRSALGPSAATLPLAIAVLITLSGIVVRLGLAPFQWATVAGSTSSPPVGAGALGGLLVGVAAVVAAKLLSGLAGVVATWSLWLAVLAAFAMVLGGLRAVTASSTRAMAAWLVVCQVGWIAAGLAVHDRRGVAAAMFLLGALLLAAVAAPALAGGGEPLSRLAGLARTEPARAIGLALVFLSLAGSPPLAGFFGEFVVGAELIRADMVWLLLAGLFGSLLALAGVVRLLRVVYLEGGEHPRAGRGRGMPAWVSAFLAPALLVLLYGLLADPVHGLAIQGAAALRLP